MHPYLSWCRTCLFAALSCQREWLVLVPDPKRDSFTVLKVVVVLDGDMPTMLDIVAWVVGLDDETAGIRRRRRSTSVPVTIGARGMITSLPRGWSSGVSFIVSRYYADPFHFHEKP